MSTVGSAYRIRTSRGDLTSCPGCRVLVILPIGAMRASCSRCRSEFRVLDRPVLHRKRREVAT